MSPRGDLLTRSIDSLASGRDLTLEQAAEVLAEIMTGNASEVQIAAFLIALRTKGETVEELAGLASTMRSLADAGDRRPTTPAGHGRHRGRAANLQRLDDGRADRRRGGLHRGQARQPLGDRTVGIRRSAGGAGGSDRPGAAGCRPVHRGRGLRFHVRAGAPPGDPLRDPGPARARRAHDLQLPRTADQSGGRAATADRRL